MLKETVKYEDFNGNTVEEDLYFNLSKAEMIDLEMSEGGAMSDRLRRIQKAQDASAMYREMKEIVLTAYGVKSEDGRRFVKSQQLRDDFMSSAAYDEFFFSLFRNEDKIVNFINNIVPTKAIEEAMAERNSKKLSVGEEPDQKVVEAQESLKQYAEKTLKDPSAETETKGTFGQTVEEPRIPTDEEIEAYMNRKKQQ